MKTVTVHTDGASRGNPGSAAIAVVIDGLTDQVIEIGETIGSTTNNQAEYRALVRAMEEIESQLVDGLIVTCYADSELMIKQLRGEYKIKDLALKPHAERILGISQAIKNRGGMVDFVAVRRHENKRADELCNLALDNLL